MKLSVLDLSIVPENGSRIDAFHKSLEVAQAADRLGYQRYWVAEHHGAGTGAGRTPEVLIPYIASNTREIRVGSGAVLLNHYSPYKVAEVFNTLEELYPGRIDMGIGRATAGPILDFAMQSNREQYYPGSNQSDAQIRELVAWMNDAFPSDHPFSQAQSYHGGSGLEFFLLGSSPWSSKTAGELGLRYSFAAFINPDISYEVAQGYFENFRPQVGRVQVTKPELILALNVFVADTEEEAQRMTAPFHVFERRLRGQGDIHSLLENEDNAIKILGGIPENPPLKDPRRPVRVLAGTAAQVYQWLSEIGEAFGTDEFMLQTATSNFEARIKMLELLAREAKLSSGV